MAVSARAWHGNGKRDGKVRFLSTWLSHLIVSIHLRGRHNYFTGEETEAWDSEPTKVLKTINGNGIYLNSSLIMNFITFSENIIILYPASSYVCFKIH